MPTDGAAASEKERAWHLASNIGRRVSNAPTQRWCHSPGEAGPMDQSGAGVGLELRLGLWIRLVLGLGWS